MFAFSDFYNDPIAVAQHMVNLDELKGDLADPSTAPNFAWLAADDATNMEGPTDTVGGLLRWTISHLLPPALGGLQYNIEAGDKWLEETLPTIFNSETWNTTESAIFLTFDEDSDNLSVGIGNEGNHIVMVAIPSALAANPDGMRGGAFVVEDHYNLYSVGRTIEETLLPDAGDGRYLTKNDEYAVPLNEFWQ